MGFYDSALQVLVKRYADGRAICNCSKAWLKTVPDPYGHLNKRKTMEICEHGCSANKHGAAEEVCRRACQELGVEWRT